MTSKLTNKQLQKVLKLYPDDAQVIFVPGAEKMLVWDELTIEEKASLDATLFDGLPNEEEINSGEDVHYDSEELRKLFNDDDYDLDAELENFEDLEDIGMVILNCEDDTEHEHCDGCDGNCGCHSNDLGFEFDSLDDLD